MNILRQMRAAGTTLKVFPELTPFLQLNLEPDNQSIFSLKTGEDGLQQDKDNIASDWRNVGNDLRAAMKQYGKQQ